MTNAAVTMVGYSYQNVTKTSMGMSQSKDSFKDVMDVAGAKMETEKTETKIEKDYSESKVDKTDKYKDEIGNAEDTYKNKAENVREPKPVEETSEADVSDEVKSAVEEAAQEAVEIIADELGVSIEEIMEVLETLGMSITDVLNVDNLNVLVATVKGEGDPLMITMDEQLYSQLNAIADAISAVNENLKEVLGLSDEEFNAIMDKLNECITDNNGKEAEVTELSANVTEAADELMEVKNEESETTDAKKDLKGDGNGFQDTVRNAENHEEATFSQNEEAHTGKESTGNAFLQNQSNSAVMQNVVQYANVNNAEMAVVEEMLSRSEVNGLDIIRQISDYMNLQKSADLTQMELQLHPASLGTINLTVSSKAGIITATIEAQNEVVKNALETQVVTLKENLEQQGLKVEAVEVTIASHEFERNLSENNEERDAYTRETENKIKRKPLRRIDLNAIEDIEDIEEPAEERIIRDMMRMNGNTVDYTA